MVKLINANNLLKKLEDNRVYSKEEIAEFVSAQENDFSFDEVKDAIYYYSGLCNQEYLYRIICAIKNIINKSEGEEELKNEENGTA